MEYSGNAIYDYVYRNDLDYIFQLNMNGCSCMEIAAVSLKYLLIFVK